jgi:hypothetical protein
MDLEEMELEDIYMDSSIRQQQLPASFIHQNQQQRHPVAPQILLRNQVVETPVTDRWNYYSDDEDENDGDHVE